MAPLQLGDCPIVFQVKFPFILPRALKRSVALPIFSLLYVSAVKTHL